MKSWTPLWSTIVTSTLWSESKDVRILFVTLLALKDADGVVMGTTVGLARLANLQYEECAKALKVLEGPDKRSDTLQEFDGRRIEKVEGGWRILNHAKYREMIQTIKRREYQRQKQAEYRMKRRNNGGNQLVGEGTHARICQEEGLEAGDEYQERIEEEIAGNREGGN